MSRGELENYLRTHLGNEIRYLLAAAAEWHAQKAMNLEEPGYEVQVYAMDSAFVHARSLFEFFTQDTTDNHYGADAFGIPRTRSKLYEKHWKAPLHSHLMHAQDRSASAKLHAFEHGESPKALNEMPVDLAREVVQLWRKFAASLQQQNNPELVALGRAADQVLSGAIAASRNVLDNRFTRDRNLPKLDWR